MGQQEKGMNRERKGEREIDGIGRKRERGDRMIRRGRSGKLYDIEARGKEG